MVMNSTNNSGFAKQTSASSARVPRISPDRTETVNELYATTRVEDNTRLRKFVGVKGTNKSIDQTKNKFNITGAFKNHNSLVASANNTPHGRNPSHPNVKPIHIHQIDLGQSYMT